MSNIFIQQEWKQVFQDQDAPFNEDLCVALINQAIKTRVDELAGNEVYLKAMSAYDQRLGPSNVHLLASLSTHEIKKVINFCPGLDQAKFSDLVYEIIVLNKLLWHIRAGRVLPSAFEIPDINEALDRLGIKIKALARKIESSYDLIPPARKSRKLDLPKFTRQVTQPNEAFVQYETIGDMFMETPLKELTQFQDMLKAAISTDTSVSPFVFVCSSSGTGKTQLPFSLSMPLLYFVYTKSISQKIYSNFDNQSDYLRQILQEDQKLYEEKYKSQKEIDAVFSYEEMNEFLEAESIPMKTYGFLVSFFKCVSSKVINNRWMRAQISLTDDLEYKPLTLIQTINEFVKLESVPVVFLDEAVDLVFGPEQHYISFRFVRSLLRIAQLVPVIMGSDTMAANFGHRKPIRYSRIDLNVWCYLVYKLPPIHPDYLLQQQADLIEDIKEIALPEQLEMIEFLFDHMRQERPLFVKCMITELKKLIRTNLKPSECLGKLFFQVYDHFVGIKLTKDDPDFINGQLEFLSPRPPKGTTPSSSLIHRHIAYFDPPDSTIQNSIYIELYLLSDGLGRFALEYRQCSYFHSLTALGQIKSVLPRFDQEPLTGFCFSAPMITDKLGMFPTTRDKPSTLLRATINASEHPNQTKFELDGHALKHLASRALVLASHTLGFDGHANFRSFFTHFLRELQLTYDANPVDFETHKEIWDLIDTTRIPYCSPVAGVQKSGAPEQVWNEQVYDYFTNKLQCLLGQVVETPHRDAVDVEMYIGNHLKYSELIAIESRLHVPPNGLDDVLNKIESFFKAGKSAKICIILVSQWSEFKTSKLEAITENIWVVGLVKDLGDAQGRHDRYRFQSLYKPAIVERVCILIDLLTTASVNLAGDNSYYDLLEKIKQAFRR